jgi:hypothetical protein
VIQLFPYLHANHCSLGIGSLIGQFTYIHYGNKTVTKHIKRGDFMPEHRLYLMAIGGFFIPFGLFFYGWTVHYQTHFMAPLVATGFIGFGLLMTFMPAISYLVDVFTIYAASAMAASTVLRQVAYVKLARATEADFSAKHVQIIGRRFHSFEQSANVWKTRLWVGELAFGLYRLCPYSDTVLVHQVRGADQEEQYSEAVRYLVEYLQPRQ